MKCSDELKLRRQLGEAQTKWWQSVRLAGLRKAAVYGRLAQGRESHLTGICSDSGAEE